MTAADRPAADQPPWRLGSLRRACGLRCCPDYGEAGFVRHITALTGVPAKASGAEVAGTGLVVGPRSRHRSGFYCPGGWWTSEQPDVLAGVHLGGLGCGPLAAAYALLPTVVSASRPAMTSDNSFFFTILPFPYRSGTKPESSRRGVAIMLRSRTTPFHMFTRVHSSRQRRAI